MWYWGRPNATSFKYILDYLRFNIKKLMLRVLHICEYLKIGFINMQLSLFISYVL